MLLERVKSQDCTSNELGTQANEDEWKAKSRELLEREGEHKIICEKILDLLNIRERYLAENEEELDEIAKLSSSAHKNRSKNSRCGSVRCLISAFDNEKHLEWVQCNFCDEWIHLMCEVTPDRDIGQIDRMPTYECLRCQRFSVQEVFQHLEHQIEHLKSEKHSLEVEVLALSDICKKYRQDQEYSMGESEKQLLNILDEIGVKRQAYHGNVFKGNHCKVILAKDKNQVYNFEKLCSVLSDRLEREHFIEVFRLYSEARSLMARKRILLDHEKKRVTSLCYKFGELFPVYFPRVALTRKIHELVFDVPRFVEEHGTVGLFSEEEGESLHHQINLESAQLSCVRSDP